MSINNNSTMPHHRSQGSNGSMGSVVSMASAGGLAIRTAERAEQGGLGSAIGLLGSLGGLMPGFGGGGRGGMDRDTLPGIQENAVISDASLGIRGSTADLVIPYSPTTDIFLEMTGMSDDSLEVFRTSAYPFQKNREQQVLDSHLLAKQGAVVGYQLAVKSKEDQVRELYLTSEAITGHGKHVKHCDTNIRVQMGKVTELDQRNQMANDCLNGNMNSKFTYADKAGSWVRTHSKFKTPEQRMALSRDDTEALARRIRRLEWHKSPHCPEQYRNFRTSRLCYQSGRKESLEDFMNYLLKVVPDESTPQQEQPSTKELSLPEQVDAIVDAHSKGPEELAKAVELYSPIALAEACTVTPGLLGMLKKRHHDEFAASDGDGAKRARVTGNSGGGSSI